MKPTDLIAILAKLQEPFRPLDASEQEIFQGANDDAQIAHAEEVTVIISSDDDGNLRLEVFDDAGSALALVEG